MSINEDDWVLAAQLTDELCKHIHAVLSRQPEDNEDKRIHSEYVLKQNRIFKVTPTGERWVVPKTARSQIVFFHHDNVRHFGAEKTLELIKGKYWFPKMKKIRLTLCPLLFSMYVQQGAHGEAARFSSPYSKI
jgi:hypothetical protein